MRYRVALPVGLALVLVAALASGGSIRLKMHDLHGEGGVPPGWKFTLPAGDPAKGKEVFATLECYSCHIVEGQGFPGKATDKTGPQLTRMGAHHPAEYFAESILDPNAVIVDDVPDWVGADGRSTMPSYNDAMTLEQWINLVAYLKSLTGGHMPGHEAAGGGHEMHGGHDMHAGHEMPGPERDKTVGEYRVRLDYTEPEAENRPGLLAVSITDAASGHAIPYLPVRARIALGKKTRTVSLAPVIGSEGLRYAAAVAVPDEADSVTVLVGAATARVGSAERGKYRTPRQVSFEW
jgi:mono/diheme cytochrome c family protein